MTEASRDTVGSPDRFVMHDKGFAGHGPQPGQLSNQLPKSMRVNSFQLIKSCYTRTLPVAETKAIGLQTDALVPCLPTGR